MIISWAWMESRLFMILRKLPFKNLFLVKIACRDGRLPPLQIGEHYSEKKELNSSLFFFKSAVYLLL